MMDERPAHRRLTLPSRRFAPTSLVKGDVEEQMRPFKCARSIKANERIAWVWAALPEGRL